MTIDTNELLRKLGSDDLIDHVDIHANVKPVLTELLDRLEVAEKNIAMKERMEKMEAALQDHHANAMCEGCDHSHPLTQLRLAAYQQSKLYADTVFALEKSK